MEGVSIGMTFINRKMASPHCLRPFLGDSGIVGLICFFMLVPLVEYIFLTTFYGLYFNHQLLIAISKGTQTNTN